MPIFYFYLCDQCVINYYHYDSDEWSKSGDDDDDDEFKYLRTLS